MQNECFCVMIKDHVAWLTLNRPDRRNVMDDKFFQGLLDIVPKLDADPEVRVIVLKAEGRSFTAGLDLSWAGALLAGGTGADARETLRQSIMKLQDSMGVLEVCKKPVIAAVHGHCIGGGIDMLCSCDIRLASEDAVFSVRETRIAIIADIGTLQRLPTLVGQAHARELALTGRDFTAAEALSMGFVTHVAPDRESLFVRAGELAKQIAGMAPLTVQGVKDVLNFGRDHGVRAGLAYVAQKNAAHIPSEDLVEAVSAFMEKRKPNFKGK